MLAEADDPRNPLLERIRFLAINSSNLDEFYAKRLAWLKQARRRSQTRRTVDGLTYAEQHDMLVDRCASMRRGIEERWRDVLSPALAIAGVHVVTYDALSTDERARLSRYFMQDVTRSSPRLSSIPATPSRSFPRAASRSRFGSGTLGPAASVSGA